jgi:alpha-N-arabinofuranosidase
MSHWVEFCNGTHPTRYANQRRRNGNDDPFAVTYWGIGNESYGDWQIGAKTVAEWGPYVAESAKMMRRVDENIVLSAAAVPDSDWTMALLKAAGRHLDLISIHGYWDHISQVHEPADYLTAILNSDSPAKMIAAARSVVGAAGFAGRIKIAFDEWNLRAWHHPNGNHPDKIKARDLSDLPATYTMADALFSAAFLNACLSNCDIVAMANVAPSVNTRGPLFVHADGIVRRTTFHTLKMYVDHIREQIVATRVEGPVLASKKASINQVDALVSTDAAGTTVTLINRDPARTAACEIWLDGHRLTGPVAATTLSGDSPDAFNSIDRPDAVRPVESMISDAEGAYPVPPHSLSMLRIPA